MHTGADPSQVSLCFNYVFRSRPFLTIASVPNSWRNPVTILPTSVSMTGLRNFCTAVRKIGGTVLPSVRQSKVGASGTAGNSEEGLFPVPVGLSILTQKQNIIENY